MADITGSAATFKAPSATTAFTLSCSGQTLVSTTYLRYNRVISCTVVALDAAGQAVAIPADLLSPTFDPSGRGAPTLSTLGLGLRFRFAITAPSVHTSSFEVKEQIYVGDVPYREFALHAYLL